MKTPVVAIEIQLRIFLTITTIYNTQGRVGNQAGHAKALNELIFRPLTQKDNQFKSLLKKVLIRSQLLCSLNDQAVL